MRSTLLATFLNEFKNSIKSPDTEEKLDLFLYRPCGFVIAKIARQLLLSPSMLSIMGLMSGLASAYYFLQSSSHTSMILASVYLVLSGIFDSADGQLARISNQTTKLGLILDGICDSLVTISVYAACALPFIQRFGAWFTIVLIIALYLHSYQCAILDFYHREYLYFGYGKTIDDTYWNPSISDCQATLRHASSRREKFMNSLRLTWIKKQQQLTTRTEMQRKIMRAILLTAGQKERDAFMREYKRNNLWLLPFWRLIGVNSHTFVMIIFMFIGRFDLYLILFDIIIYNLIIVIVGQLQKDADQSLFRELRISVLTKPQ